MKINAIKLVIHSLTIFALGGNLLYAIEIPSSDISKYSVIEVDVNKKVDINVPSSKKTEMFTHKYVFMVLTNKKDPHNSKYICTTSAIGSLYVLQQAMMKHNAVIEQDYKNNVDKLIQEIQEFKQPDLQKNVDASVKAVAAEMTKSSKLYTDKIEEILNEQCTSFTASKEDMEFIDSRIIYAFGASGNRLKKNFSVHVNKLPVAYLKK